MEQSWGAFGGPRAEPDVRQVLLSSTGHLEASAAPTCTVQHATIAVIDGSHSERL